MKLIRLNTVHTTKARLTERSLATSSFYIEQINAAFRSFGMIAVVIYLLNKFTMGVCEESGRPLKKLRVRFVRALAL